MLIDLEFHHIAVATKDIKKSISKFEGLGFNSSIITIDTNQNVSVCFLNKLGHPQIELVEPLNSKSPVSEILRKSGTTTYHFCYVVEDIDKQILELRKQSFILLQKPIEASAFNNNKICFLYNSDIGLIELLEK